MIAAVQEKTLRTPGNCVIFLSYYLTYFNHAGRYFMRRPLVLAVFVLLISATQVWAEFYRWVDKDGKEFFTNEPSKIPQEYRSSATKMEPDESRVSVGSQQSTKSKARVTVSEHRDKNGKGESYWRKRAADLRLKLRDQETRRDLVVKQMNDQDQKPLSTKNKKARASLEKKKTKLDTDIARTRRALEVDLPEEARKADAYPGWIRE